MTPQLPDLTNVPELPLILSLLIVFFLLLGSLFTFIGALGLACFRNFYDRLHMPALGTTIGVTAVLLGTSLYISYIEGHIIGRDILIIFFLAFAAPINGMMLARAAAMRDFTQNWHDPSDNMFHRLVTDETDTQLEQEENKNAANQGTKTALAPTHTGKATPKTRHRSKNNDKSLI
ncbi:monovalent cation/H(+) antiporter subunit G [Candidatus Tokpelaia sp.]|uniref:monovalent cation/H(+) antiporter subunit G n=1 Tax=Candidatus Tokpelaia sp. TaxID=2233777 RepID=UPI00123C35EA|nr:monovalent cation/H(+) antiporter subunit G [Candidatus Tokpelaia sp.]KAA6404594.1 hypothetical protein DPQ22_08925 [Candidatus Tokpelaia sp.]